MLTKTWYVSSKITPLKCMVKEQNIPYSDVCTAASWSFKLELSSIECSYSLSVQKTTEHALEASIKVVYTQKHFRKTNSFTNCGSSSVGGLVRTLVGKFVWAATAPTRSEFGEGVDIKHCCQNKAFLTQFLLSSLFVFFFLWSPKQRWYKWLRRYLALLSSCETLPVSSGHLESQSHAVVISSDSALLVWSLWSYW